MTKAEGVEYIKEQLINGKLIMADATEKTGWSFPRIRSRAITICKKLGGSFVKENRGVYIYDDVSRVSQPVEGESTGNEDGSNL